jgi:hypothetical protein
VKSLSRIAAALLLLLGLERAASSAAAPPGAFALTAPANGATGVALLPTLTWGAASGATSYTLEVATDAGFSAIVLTQTGIVSTSYTPGAPVGQGLTFFWRVTALGGGSTLATGAPFSFTTLILPPGAFVLTAPANAATGVALLPTFTWAAASGAATYTLEVSTDSGFSAVVVSQSGLGTPSFTLGAPLTGGSNYYWRVTAVNAGGSTGSTGAAFSFTTLTTGPGAFALLYPNNLSTGVDLNPYFFWDDATGVTTYTMELATDPGFSSLVFQVSGLPGSSFGTSLSLTPLTTYYWRVTAINGTGSTMGTGAPFHFQTGNFSGSSSGSGFVGSSGNGCGLLGPELLALWALGLLRRRLRQG